MKHTGQPWSVQAILPDAAKKQTFEPRIAIVAQSAEFGTVRIADIPDVTMDDIDEQLGNATLMASAQEMFDLLREVYENQGADGWSGSQESRSRFEALMARLDVTPPIGSGR